MCLTCQRHLTRWSLPWPSARRLRPCLPCRPTSAPCLCDCRHCDSRVTRPFSRARRVTIWDTDSFSCLQKYPAELMTSLRANRNPVRRVNRFEPLKLLCFDCLIVPGLSISLQVAQHLLFFLYAEHQRFLLAYVAFLLEFDLPWIKVMTLQVVSSITWHLTLIRLYCLSFHISTSHIRNIIESYCSVPLHSECFIQFPVNLSMFCEPS